MTCALSTPGTARSRSRNAFHFASPTVSPVASTEISDGSLTGVLWYLHYRIAVGMDDARAREQAARLGLKPESEEQRTLLLAAKALLEEMK